MRIDEELTKGQLYKLYKQGKIYILPKRAYNTKMFNLISKTYLFQIAQFLAWALVYAGVKLEVNDLVVTLNVLVAIAMGIGTLYGRFKAGGVKWFGVHK